MAAASNDDDNVRKPLLKSYAEMGDPSERAEKAMRKNTRASLDSDTPIEDLMAAFKTHNLIEPKDIARPAHVEVGSMTLPLRRWFIAQTKPQAEALVVREITKHGMHVCAPEVATWATVHRQEVVRVRPMFPRYVFVGIEPDRRGDVDFRTPRLCDGVAGFVQSAGGVAEVRDTAVGDLMFANERRWIDFTMSTKARGVAKRMSFKNPEFVEAMKAIMKAAPSERIRLFLDCFGKRARLLHYADG